MELGYRGSVNRWECDENDHMNVRFYLQRHMQALGATMHGLMATQHIRFQAESRIAVPQSGYRSVLNGGTQFTELRHSVTDQVMSTCIHVPFGVVDAPVGVPDYGAPRGVSEASSPYAFVHRGKVESLGFACIGAGVIQASETSQDGILENHHYLGRISDGMPHLWSALRPESDDNEGGAVLEYRLAYAERGLRLGDAFEIWSGLAEVGKKVQRFVHLIFNAEGACVVCAEAAAVRMNLTTRRAVTLDESEQVRLRALCLKPA